MYCLPRYSTSPRVILIGGNFANLFRPVRPQYSGFGKRRRNKYHAVSTSAKYPLATYILQSHPTKAQPSNQGAAKLKRRTVGIGPSAAGAATIVGSPTSRKLHRSGLSQLTDINRAGWSALLPPRNDQAEQITQRLAGCGKTRFEADAVPRNSLVSTVQPDKKKACEETTSSSWMCSAT